MRYSNHFSTRIVLAILSFFVFTLQAQAQQTGTLTGTITDEKGQPAEQATIGDAKQSKFTMAGAKGHYKLTLSAGKHTITCSMVGHETQAFEINIAEGGNAVQNFKLKKSDGHQLQDVTLVKATAKRQIETSGFAVNVIDTKEASLRNIQTNELLSRTVGVRVRQNGGLGSAVEYNLNGMSGRSIGIFIDGIEISTYGSSFSLNNIPPSMIERIEVYKGVLPAHLSGDYMGGAINVILKKDASTNNVAASVSYGSFNTFQADASGMYRNAKNGFTVKASAFYTYSDNSYETWGKFSKFITYNGIVQRNYRAKRFNDSYRSLGGRFEMGFTNVKWANQFLLSYSVSETHNEIPHGQTMGRPYVGRFNNANAHVFSLNYNKTDLLVKGLNFTFNGVYSNRGTYLQDTVGWVYNWDGNYRLDINQNPMYRVGEGQQGVKVITDINRHITTLRSNLSYDIFSGHRISLNHVYYTVGRNDADLLNPVNNSLLKTVSDIKKNVFPVNYEAQVLNNKLKTNLFGKYYRQDVGRTTPTVTNVNGQKEVDLVYNSGMSDAWGYGATVAYTVIPKVIVIGSAERAVRMPGETEILGDPNDNVLSNFTIKPEVSTNYNIGFRLGSFDFGQHKFTLSGNAFWRNVKDRIMRQAANNLASQEIEVSPFVNLGLAQSLGFEGELGYNYNNKLNFLFNFSKFNSLYKGSNDPQSRLSPYYNKQIPNEPFFTMNGNAEYRLQGIFQKKSVLNLFYNFGYVAPFRTVWPESDWFTTPTQFAHDFGVNYKFPNKQFIISLDAKNVFNSEIYDNFGVQKPGRAFYAKLNYIFNKF